MRKPDPSAANLAARLAEKTCALAEARTEYMDLERVVIALARRQGGALVFSEAELELKGFPPGTGIARICHPDGRVVFQVVCDEPEPGRAG